MVTLLASLAVFVFVLLALSLLIHGSRPAP